MDKQTDAELVTQALAGRPEAFAPLVRRYQDYAYGTAIGMLSDFDLARDVVQDAFLCAYRDLRKLKEPSRFGGWLHGIVKNTAHRALRELRKTQTLAEQLRRTAQLSAPPPGRDRSAGQSEIRTMVRRALAHLSQPNREAVSLYYVDGLSYADIAGFLSVSETTVRGRLYRGRAKLRKELSMVAQTFKEQQLPEDFAAEIKRLLDAVASRAAVREETIRRLAEIGAPAVDPLCKALGDSRIVVRQAAARALCTIGDPRAIRPILRVLYAGDYWISNEVMRNGRILAISGVRDELLRIVAEGTEKDRWWAMEALAHARGDNEVFDCLLQIFRDPADPNRRQALAALCQLRPDMGAELIPEALHDPELQTPGGWAWWIAVQHGYQIPIDTCVAGFGRNVAANSRMLAGWLVLRHEAEGEKALEELLRTGTPDQRATAAVALAGKERPEVFEALVGELLHGYRERKWMRIVARPLVREYGDRLLAWAAEEKPDLTNRPALAWALGKARIAAGLAGDDDVLRYGSPTIRAEAVRELAEEDGPRYAPQLRRLLREGTPRKVAQRAFRQMLRLGEAAMPTVQQMLESEHWTERKAALCLLRRWGKLTHSQQYRGRQDPHVAVRHAADWHPSYAEAVKKRHPKWTRRIGGSGQ